MLFRAERRARAGPRYPTMERPGPHRAFFDLWSRVYDAPWVQRLTYRPAQDRVLSSLGRAGAARVLDVGCGTGQLASRIAAAPWARRVVGCDFSAGMLARARQRSARVRWVRGDALRLPFRDAAFDAVVSTEAFHWFPDQAAALAEFHRVLAPGGALRIAVIHPPAEWLSRLTAAGSRMAGEPLLWPTREAMRRLLAGAGFRVESQRTVLRLPATWILPTVVTEAVRPG